MKEICLNHNIPVMLPSGYLIRHFVRSFGALLSYRAASDSAADQTRRARRPRVRRPRPARSRARRRARRRAAAAHRRPPCAARRGPRRRARPRGASLAKDDRSGMRLEARGERHMGEMIYMRTENGALLCVRHGQKKCLGCF